MIVAGGGTGGHLFPGLAVAEAVAQRSGDSVLFVGSAYGLEATAIPRTSYPFHALAVRGVRGRGVLGALSFAWHLPLALFQSWRIVAAFRPNLILGLGGYGSVPMAVIGWLARIPLVLLEQNAHPGLANRLLGRLARKVCTTYAESAQFFPRGKAEHTGNPVRQLAVSRPPAPHGFTLFAFGGSQGAHAINRALVEAAPVLAREVTDLRIIHQTGAADLSSVQQQYEAMGISAEVVEFVRDMADAYSRADLVLCRAGATTLAELAALGKPAILVPYPYAADDHQRKNAEVLRQAGAAELIVNAEFNAQTLAATIIGLVRDNARLQNMSAAAARLAVPDATARVVRLCRQMAAAEEMSGGEAR